MLNNSKKVPSTVIRRLPRYYRYLSGLLEKGVTRISSKELSVRMGVTASQIRQDFNFFGGFGQQGYGYNVEYLCNEVGTILGMNKKKNMIIVGAGNLGRALANYESFKKRGFELVGIFDIDMKLIGQDINGLAIREMNEIEHFTTIYSVDIAALCVPEKETLRIAERLIKCGIKAFWNFSPIDLELPDGVVVENVHLSDSIVVLSYKLMGLIEVYDRIAEEA